MKKDFINIWIDEFEIRTGDSITEKISHGLKDSNFFIIVISRNSINSEWVNRELNATLMRQITKRDIKILPVVLNIEFTELPPLIQDIKAVRFSRNRIDTKNYKKLIEPIKDRDKSDALTKFQDVYFENIEHIDLILSKEKPTRQEISFALKLIEKKEYRNYFFKKIQDVKWFEILKQYGCFSPDEAPVAKRTKNGGYYLPIWDVLDYLEQVSKRVYKPGNERFSDELISIIKEVTSYHLLKRKSLDNFRTWWYFVKILLNIPNNKISFDIMKLIPAWLDSQFDNILQGGDIASKLLPKFLNSNNPEDWKKADKIIEYVTAIKWINVSKIEKKFFKKKEEPILVLEPYWLLKAFKENVNEIGTKCNRDLIFIIAARLKEILKKEFQRIGKYQDFSQYWFSSLFSDPGKRIHSPKEALTLILRDIILVKARCDDSSSIVVFNRFLSNEYPYPIFKRIFLYAIGNEWEKYKNIFWDLVETDKSLSLFNKHVFEPEVYKILELNAKNFTIKEKELIKKIINKGPSRKMPEENRRNIIATWKQKWYSAIKSDPYFISLYEKQKKITKKEEVINFRRVQFKWGEGPSPISKEEMLRMSNAKIANYLINFKEKDHWEGPTIGGLSIILKSCVEEYPEKFVEGLNEFFHLGYLYIYDILHGIKDGWKNKKSINWANLFKFIKRYIKRSGFWKDKYIVDGDNWPASHYWITGMIGELVQEGTKDDNWVFSEDHFDDAKEILFELLDQEIVEENVDRDDYVTFALNSVHGKLITALIFLALRIARVKEKKGIKKDVKWSLDIKKKYEELLSNEITEACILFGQYMPQLNYLDKNWVEDKVSSFIHSVKPDLWEAFMSGYLFEGLVYKGLYILMREHYLQGIEFPFKDKNSRDQLVQHISLGYLQGYENFSKESLFSRLLKKWDLSQIKEVIRYFWMQHDLFLEKKGIRLKAMDRQKKDEMKSKIVEFWKEVFNERYKKDKSLKKKDKEILSELSKLTVFLERIDIENREWLLKLAPYVHINFNSPFFIECLNNIKDKDEETTKNVSDIFLKMLESFTPDFDKDHIRSIIDYLYKTCNKDNADIICNLYGSMGYDDLLRDIYEEGRKRKGLCEK